MTDATINPRSGLWQPTSIDRMVYGPDSVQKHLVSSLPSKQSKAVIITGQSLATKTPLIKNVESLLGDHHAATFSNIRQHAPEEDLNEAAQKISSMDAVDTIISIGGGSPIDTAKLIFGRVLETNKKSLYHITIPTTLSCAEGSMAGGYTKNGKKTALADPKFPPKVILYDASFAKHTPQKLWLSTAIRALDHAVETLYHPTASFAPTHYLAVCAIQQLFEYLPKNKADPENVEFITRLQLAAFASLSSIGTNLKGGLGLSHSLGYALGSPYSIPHGITSCITLAKVVRMKAETPEYAEQLTEALSALSLHRSGDDKKDAYKIADAIDKLVEDLGLSTKLRDYKVGEDQVPVIAEAASGKKDGELYEKLQVMVKSML